ncbi:MAG TPA: hypothetical protein VK021_00725 [Flavobacteriaceae bacterium]|nr:hypothetical protein [Flavobacteriaceae bacterium]
MLVPFEKLPDSARVWVYQANRKFTDEEVNELRSELENFVQEWTVHGADLSGSFDIRYNRFIVLGVDENFAATSGCSIDSSVHFIQHLQEKFDVDLLDKMNVTFRQGEYIAHKELKDFGKMVKDRAVSPDTIVFNNLVNTKGELEEHWEVPLKESWHKRFL